jgi:hypothetical protein
MIQVLPCPNCQGPDIARHGKTRQGKQRHLDAEQDHMGQENTHETSSDSHTPVLFRKACLAESAS